MIGEVEATEDYLAEYESPLDTLQGLIAEKDPETLSLIRVQDEDFIIYMPGTFGGAILTEAGLGTPQAQIDAAILEEDSDYYYASRERLDLLDGDVMFLFVAYPDPDVIAASQALIDSLDDDPLFQSLSATQSGNVHQVGGHWYGDGIFSAHKVLDDLFTIIAGVDPVEVSPNPFASDTQEAPEATATAEVGS